MSGLKFLFPIDGDCLSDADGISESGVLTVPVKLECPEGGVVSVNGVAAALDNGVYTANVRVNGPRDVLVASNGAATAEAVVYRPAKAFGHYRISIDDSVLFLADINEHRDEYKSIFENPFLAMLKKAHDEYAACAHLNIYYEFNESSMRDFSFHRKYFDLSMMTDKFKAEWEANSNWLRLSFHAKANYPDRPYKYSTYAEVYHDAMKVNSEIVRFAGEKTLSCATTLHWGEASEDGVRALYDAGYRELAGYFVMHKGQPLVSYFYGEDMVAHIGERDFFRGREQKITFGRIDSVMNYYKTPETLTASLEGVLADRTRAGFLELLIHEEYFYEDYRNYIPEYKNIVAAAAKFARDHGYDGSLFSEAVADIEEL